MSERLKKSQTFHVAMTAWISRAIVLGLQFYFIRLTIARFGGATYTAMAMTLGLQSWVSLADLGLASSLQQRLATFRDDPARCLTLISYVHKLLVRVSIVLGPLAGGLAYILADHYLEAVDISLMDKRLGFSIGICSLVVMAIGQTAQRLLLGLGRGVRANVFLALGVAASVAGGITGGSLWSERPFAGMAAGYGFGAGVFWWCVFFQYARNGALTIAEDDRRELHRLARETLLFLVFAAAVLSVDYVVLSKVCSQRDILIYSLSSKIFLPIFLIVSLFFASFQPMATYMLANGQNDEVKGAIRRIIFVGFISVFVVLLVVLMAERSVLHWLAPGENIEFEVGFIAILLLYYLTRIWTDGHTVVIMAAGKPRLILPAVVTQAVIAAPLQYFFGNRWGLIGLISGLCLCFLSTVAWYIPLQVAKLCKSRK